MTKAGFVTIIGKPNAGKSTLMNALIGADLSIVTDKPQTTRKKILGILTGDNVQYVFNDTPGLLEPRYEMQKSMMDFVESALIDADILLFLFDAVTYSSENKVHKIVREIAEKSKLPKIAILNKTDLIKDKKELLPLIASLSEEKLFDEVIPISALASDNLDLLLKTLEARLPESEFYYDSEILSTQTERFFAAEIIRETVFNETGDEIPYSTEVQISEFKERDSGKWYIAADIIVERTSQKKIIIGAKGEKIKKIGQVSRIKIEEHLEYPIYLELFVKVRSKWRNNKNLLKTYGYNVKK